MYGGQILLIFLCVSNFAHSLTSLSLPKKDLCASRKLHYKIGKNGYYVSWLESKTRNLFLNWLDARNWCRDRCMDLVSLESPLEMAVVRELMKKCKF